MRRSNSTQVHRANFEHYIDTKLQGIPDREYTLRLLIENEEKEVTIVPGHKSNARMSIFLPTTYISDGCEHVEILL